ncbi:MAG: metal-dependent hydrolase [Candidatus Hadarchaeaceae archaeon]
MPYPALHFAIPFSVALACGVSLKKSFLFGFIAMLPDFDIIFGVHRSAIHSILVLLLALVIALYFKFMRSKGNFGLTSLALLSHPILDLFDGFTPILWPLLNSSLHLKVSLASLNIELLSSPVLFPKSSLLFYPPSAWQLVASIIMIIMGIALRAAWGLGSVKTR